ncbi:putative extracellular solute-binding protein [Actinacidiphila reveromycinica]|uniref:Putative extracellular solute-binding protein n=1 Tax=Actinacidiphila reveromycinica TaxID=659352 RepID=A0A7U3UQP0_9ACTN|nr:glutamate ABC transporter substrate-binding protein [Streptomyces sp. SN-593]BBA96953.1 putative extracellular solute-binding protein [Streptomyces sp. SN-593]
MSSIPVSNRAGTSAVFDQSDLFATRIRRVRVRRAAVAAVLAVSAFAVTACSGSSSGSPKTGNVDKAVATDASVDDLVTSEQPAAASLLPDGSTAAKIKAKGVLRVGGTQTTAMFSLLNPTTGKIEGFDSALSRLLAKYIIGKDSTKLTTVTSATREALLKNGSVDTVFATYVITPEREKVVAFAGPYYEDGLGLQVRKNENGITNLKDLAGKTVVTGSGSTATTAVKKAAPSAKIQLCDINAECLQALQQGRADAYVMDQGLLAGNALTNTDVKVLSGTFSAEPYGIGLPLDEPDFKVFVNDWLKKITADGTWAKVWKATVGTAVPGAAPTPPTVG